MRFAFGLAGGILTLVGASIYIRALLKETIRPHPFTFGAWAIIGAIGAISSISAGAGWGAIILVIWTIYPALVCILSLRKQTESPEVSFYVPLICLLGVFGWLISDAPLIAAIAAVIADAAALWPTIIKTWREPSSEPVFAWSLDSLACALAIVGIADYRLAAFIYPVYLLVFNLVMAMLSSRKWLSV
jgi:hypothetical protein